MQQPKGKFAAKENKSSERIELKFSIPKFSTMSKSEKTKILGWSIAIILIVILALGILVLGGKKPAGLPEKDRFNLPTTPTGELKVETKQDVKKATLVLGNDLEGLIGSLAQIGAGLK